MVLNTNTVHSEGKIIYSFKHTRAVEIATKCDQEARGGPVWKPPTLEESTVWAADFKASASAPNQTRWISAGPICCLCSRSKPNQLSLSHPSSAALAVGPLNQLSLSHPSSAALAVGPNSTNWLWATPALLHLQQVQTQPYGFHPLAEFVEPAATTWLDTIFSCCSPGLCPYFSLLPGQLDVQVLLSFILGALLLPNI